MIRSLSNGKAIVFLVSKNWFALPMMSRMKAKNFVILSSDGTYSAWRWLNFYLTAWASLL